MAFNERLVAGAAVQAGDRALIAIEQGAESFQGDRLELWWLMYERLGRAVKISDKNARRARLWIFDSRCAYCAEETIWWDAPGWMPDDAATLQHLHSRLNPKRSAFSKAATSVLACRRCNFIDGRDEYMTLPLTLRTELSKQHRLPKYLRTIQPPWRARG